MCSNPRCEIRLGNAPCSHSHHFLDRIDRFCDQIKSIHREEQTNCLKGDSFVSIDEGMILCQAKAIRSGERSKVRIRVVVKTMEGTGQCRIQ